MAGLPKLVPFVFFGGPFKFVFGGLYSGFLCFGKPPDGHDERIIGVESL